MENGEKDGRKASGGNLVRKFINGNVAIDGLWVVVGMNDQSRPWIFCSPAVAVSRKERCLADSNLKVVIGTDAVSGSQHKFVGNQNGSAETVVVHECKVGVSVGSYGIALE